MTVEMRDLSGQSIHLSSRNVHHAELVQLCIVEIALPT